MTASCDSTQREPASVVVVAHPDDEALWLSSALAAATRIVYCFGDLFERPRDSQARRAALAAVPLPGTVELAVPESGAGVYADWTRPQPTAFGIHITEPDARKRYEANYPRIVAGLREALAGFDRPATVVSESPDEASSQMIRTALTG